MISREGSRLQLNWLLEAAKVSKSGYYEWKDNQIKREQREEKDRADFDLILEAYNYRGYKKGARSIYMRLLRSGKRMNLKKIRRLMRKYNLICPIRRPNPYRKALREDRDNKKYENVLDRNFKGYGPRKVLLTDITYLYYYNSQRCYMSSVKDPYTNECLGYAMSQNLKLEFVLKTFANVARDYGDTIRPDAIVHSDQGSHYTSVRFSKFMEDFGYARSMSRKAECWDNAPQESFFGHMKDEIGDKVSECRTFAEVKAAVDKWVDYYNNDRPQWGLAKLTPSEYYEYCTTGEYPSKRVKIAE